MDRIAVHHHHIFSFNIALGVYKNQFKKIRYNEIITGFASFVVEQFGARPNPRHIPGK
jgi:hypothetical protein